MDQNTHAVAGPHPVVAIEIRDGSVRINGEVVENPLGQEPHQLAVHHVARSIAGTLGRPVRARATDAGGTMRMVVHPDGQVSELTEEPGEPAAASEDQLEDLEQTEHSSGYADELGELSPLEDLLSHDSSDGVEPQQPTTLQPSTQQTPEAGRAVAGDQAAAFPAVPGGVPLPEEGRPLFVEGTPGRRRRDHHQVREGRSWETSETPRVRDPLGPDTPTGQAGQTGPAAAAARPAELSEGSAAAARPAEPAPSEMPSEDYSFLTRHQSAQPARTGWRGALTRMGIDTAPSERERSERADVYAISRHWPGPRTIAIVNGKGGAGKTPTTVILSALFARHGGSGILAWDNNETRGTLGWRTEQGPHESHVLDLLPHSERLMLPTARAADLAAFVHHQTDDKYDVLRSNPLLTANQQRLTEADFDAVHQVASKYFRLIFIDSGNDETAPHWLRMIDHADQLVVATTTRPDHAEAGRLLLDALRQRDQRSARLADQAVVVVSQADREEALADEIASGYAGRARTSVTIPYDRALRAPWLRFGSLADATQRAYLRAAAAVSEGL